MIVTTLPVRVMVLDNWEEYRFAVAPTMRVAALKQAALDHAQLGERRPHDYVVKFRGAELLDQDDQTLEGSGIVPNAALIVLSRKRNPAK